MIKILEPIIKNNQIEYKISINNVTYNFFVKYFNYKGEINKNIDGIVVMLIPIAICNNLSIHSKFPIDKSLYNNLYKIPLLYQKYYEKHPCLLGKIIKKEDIILKLDLPVIERVVINNNNGISTLSLGIDSTYNLFKNNEFITHLLYVNTLDFSNSIPKLHNSLKYISRKYKKQLIIAESNVKEVVLKMNLNGTNYGVFTSHGILMMHFYPLNMKNIYFNGTSYTPFLNGESVELTNCFFSNEYNISIPNLLRIDKLKYILEYDDDILNYLRVCNNTYDGKNINCSKCVKCKRTILFLYILGYYDKIKTFEKPKDVTDYIDFYISNMSEEKNMTESSKYINSLIINIIDNYKIK